MDQRGIEHPRVKRLEDQVGIQFPVGASKILIRPLDLGFWISNFEFWILLFAQNRPDHTGSGSADFKVSILPPKTCYSVACWGASLDRACTHHQRTALCVAARRGHSPVIQVLCEAGANKDQPDIWGASPLLHACRAGHFQSARMLCQARANAAWPRFWLKYSSRTL